MACSACLNMLSCVPAPPAEGIEALANTRVVIRPAGKMAGEGYVDSYKARRPADPPCSRLPWSSPACSSAGSRVCTHAGVQKARSDVDSTAQLGALPPSPPTFPAPAPNASPAPAALLPSCPPAPPPPPRQGGKTQRSFSGSGADEDIVVSSARAYVRCGAVNGMLLCRPCTSRLRRAAPLMVSIALPGLASQLAQL